jgi:hypothetical protein
VSGSTFGPWLAVSGRNWPTHGGSRWPATPPSSGLARPAPRPTVRACGRDRTRSPRPETARWRGQPRLAGVSHAAGSGARSRRRWGGCAGQEDRRRGSPNRRHTGGAVGRCGVVAVDSGGAGMVVTDGWALALHHGEGESEVRWGRD